MRSAEEGGRDPEFTQPLSRDRKSRPCYCITIGKVLPTEAAHGACLRLQLANPAMQRERQRMCSRQGGMRGRASTRRQGHISPSSSIEVTLVPQQFQCSNDEGGRGARRDARAEGAKEESPTLFRALRLIQLLLSLLHLNLVLHTMMQFTWQTILSMG